MKLNVSIVSKDALEACSYFYLFIHKAAPFWKLKEKTVGDNKSSSFFRVGHLLLLIAFAPAIHNKACMHVENSIYGYDCNPNRLIEPVTGSVN